MPREPVLNNQRTRPQLARTRQRASSGCVNRRGKPLALWMCWRTRHKQGWTNNPLCRGWAHPLNQWAGAVGRQGRSRNV